MIRQSALARFGRWSRLVAAAAALAVGGAVWFGASASVRADEKPAAAGKSIDELAKEGYLLGEKKMPAEHANMLGKAAPNLELTDWIGGPVKAKDLKDKIIIVDFWATWCGPCLKAVPHNNEVAKKYADKGVLLIGACSADGAEAMPKVVEKYKMAYPVAKVSDASVKAWNVGFWPTYAVIDRKGNVRAVGVSPTAVDQIVDALLVEQPAANK